MSMNYVSHRGGSVLGIVVVFLISSTMWTSPAASEPIRGSRGEVFGHLRDAGSSIRLTDAQYKTLGYYLRIRDVTVDAAYKVIGPGNQLGRLLGR